MFQFPIENIPSNYVIQNKPNSDIVTLNNVDDLLKHLYYSITEAPYSSMNKIDPSRFTFRHNLKYKISNSELDILDDIFIRFETNSVIDILLLPGTVSIFIGCDKFIDLEVNNSIKTTTDVSTKHNIQTLDELLDIKTITNSRVNYLYTIINIPLETFIKPEHIYIAGDIESKIHGYIQIDRKTFIEWYKNIHSFNALETSEMQYHSRYNNILPDSVYNMYLSNKYITNNTLEMDISMDNTAGKIFLPMGSIFSLTNINIEWVHNSEYILPVDRLLSGIHCHDLLPSNNLQLFYKYYYETPFFEISEELDKNQCSIYIKNQKRIKSDKKLIKIPTYYNERTDNICRTIPKIAQSDLNHSTIYIDLIVCRINRSGKHIKYIPRIPGLDKLKFQLYKCDTNIYNCLPQDNINKNYFPFSIFKSNMYEKGSLSSSGAGYNMEQNPIITSILTSDSKFKYKVSEFNFKYPDYEYTDPDIDDIEPFYIPKDGGGLYIPKLKVEFECDKIVDNQYLAISIELDKKIFYNTIKYCASLEDREKLQLWLDTPCSVDRVITDKQLLSIGDQRNNIEPISLYDKAAILEPANYWFENLFPQMETYRDIEDIRERSIQDEDSDTETFVIKTRLQYLKKQSDNGMIRGRIFIPRGTRSLSIFQSPYAYQEIDYMIFSLFKEDICLPNQTIPIEDITNKIENEQNKITGSEPTYGEPYTPYSFFTKDKYEIARFIYTRYMFMPDDKKALIKDNFIGEDFINNNPIEIFKTYYTTNEIEDVYGITIPSNNNKITSASNVLIEVFSDTSEILFSTRFMELLWRTISKIGDNEYSLVNKPGTWIYFNFYKSNIGENAVVLDKYIFLTINSKEWKEFYYKTNITDYPDNSIIENSRFPYNHEEKVCGCAYEQCLSHNFSHDGEYCYSVNCDACSNVGGECMCYCREWEIIEPGNEWIEWNPQYTHCDYESKDMWIDPCEEIINETITSNKYKYFEIVGGNRLTAHLKITNIDKSQIENILTWFYIGDIKIEPLDDDYTITINNRTYIVDETYGAGNIAYYDKGVQEGYDSGFTAGCKKESIRIYDNSVTFTSNEFYIQGFQSENGYSLGYLDSTTIWDIDYVLGEIAGFNDGYNNNYDNQIYPGDNGFCGSTAYTSGYDSKYSDGETRKVEYNLGMKEGFYQGQIDMCYREIDRPNNYTYTGSNSSYYKSGWEYDDSDFESGYISGRNYWLDTFNSNYDLGFQDGDSDGSNCQNKRVIPDIPDPITDDDRLIFNTMKDIAYVFGYNDIYETRLEENNCLYDLGLFDGYTAGYNEGCQLSIFRQFNDEANHNNQDYNDGYRVGYNETYASTIAIWDTNFILGETQGIIDGNNDSIINMTHPNIIEHNLDCTESDYYDDNTKCGECVRKAYFTAYLIAYENTWLSSDNYIHEYNSTDGTDVVPEIPQSNINSGYNRLYTHWLEIDKWGFIDNIWFKIKEINHENPEQLQIGIEHKMIDSNHETRRYLMLMDRHGLSGEGENFQNTIFNKNALKPISDNTLSPPYTGTFSPDIDPEYDGLNIDSTPNWMPRLTGVEFNGFWALHILDKDYTGDLGTAPVNTFNMIIYEDKEKHCSWHKYDYVSQPEDDLTFIDVTKQFILNIFEEATIANTLDGQIPNDKTHLKFKYDIECLYHGNPTIMTKKIFIYLKSPDNTSHLFGSTSFSSPLTDTIYVDSFNDKNINGDWKLFLHHGESLTSYEFKLKSWSIEFVPSTFTINSGILVSYITDTTIPLVIGDRQRKFCYFDIQEDGFVNNLEFEFSIEDYATHNVSDADYEIRIHAPGDSVGYKILDDVGFGFVGFKDTILSDAGANGIQNDMSPHTGKFKAYDGNSVVNISDYANGKPLNGNWKINFYDKYNSNSGQITKCKIHFKLY